MAPTLTTLKFKRYVLSKGKEMRSSFDVLPFMRCGSIYVWRSFPRSIFLFEWGWEMWMWEQIVRKLSSNHYLPFCISKNDTEFWSYFLANLTHQFRIKEKCNQPKPNHNTLALMLFLVRRGIFESSQLKAKEPIEFEFSDIQLKCQE